MMTEFYLLMLVLTTVTGSDVAIATRTENTYMASPSSAHVPSLKPQLLLWCLMFNKQCLLTDKHVETYMQKYSWDHLTWGHRDAVYRCSLANMFAEGAKINEALKSKLIVAEDMRPEVEITGNDKHVYVSDRDFDVFVDLVNVKLHAAEMKAAKKAKIVKDAIWHKIFTILVTGPQMPLM